MPILKAQEKMEMMTALFNEMVQNIEKEPAAQRRCA